MQLARDREYDLERFAAGRGRYQYAVLQKEGRRFFLKAGYTHQEDYDEPILLHNLQREVWWATVIEALERSDGPLPFTSPVCAETNVTRRGCPDPVAWVIFTFEEALPLAGASIWDIGQAGKEWDERRIALFHQHLPSLCAVLATLEGITSESVRHLGVPIQPPHAPHGELALPKLMRVFLKENTLLVDSSEYRACETVLAQGRRSNVRKERVLGQGDFEVSHLHVRNDGKVVLVDNEFGGWYPRLDSLTYCYHRLWANRRRPDLARELLDAFVGKYIPKRKRSWFFGRFYPILLPRTLRGFYYDATRRGLPPWHENQVRRRELVQAILARDHRTLGIH